MASFQWNGFSQLMSGLDSLASPDPTPLLEEWEGVIRRDNKRGILAGEDKDGNPLKPVKYRPVGAPSTQRVKKHQRNNAGVRGVFAGLGPHAAGLNNNLTSREYRFLGGPPLAPRGTSSRVITNLVTAHTTAPVGGEWAAFGWWDEVVSTKGVPFLIAHFEGLATGRGHKVKLPVRDLRGVRPRGKQEALRALRKWGAALLKAIG